MKQIVSNLISALGVARSGQVSNDMHTGTPMAELDCSDLACVVGGDGDGSEVAGPRGGWKASLPTTA